MNQMIIIGEYYVPGSASLEYQDSSLIARSKHKQSIHPSFLLNSNRLCFIISVSDPLHFDADPDPDPRIRFQDNGSGSSSGSGSGLASGSEQIPIFF